MNRQLGSQFHSADVVSWRFIFFRGCVLFFEIYAWPSPEVKSDLVCDSIIARTDVVAFDVFICDSIYCGGLSEATRRLYGGIFNCYFQLSWQIKKGGF